MTFRGAATCGHSVMELPTVWTARRCEVREMMCGGESLDELGCFPSKPRERHVGGMSGTSSSALG